MKQGHPLMRRRWRWCIERYMDGDDFAPGADAPTGEWVVIANVQGPLDAVSGTELPSGPQMLATAVYDIQIRQVPGVTVLETDRLKRRPDGTVYHILAIMPDDSGRWLKLRCVRSDERPTCGPNSAA